VHLFKYKNSKHATNSSEDGLQRKGFNLTVGHAVVSFLMQRGFHPRLGAHPLRDTIEKYLRGAVADALLSGITSRRWEFIVSGSELALRPC
jgi:ATP-dependent Clp protease ATP-binding subunit ClpA